MFPDFHQKERVMRPSKKAIPAVLWLLCGLIASMPICEAREPLEIPLALPQAAALGNQGGATRISLGEVTDECFAESSAYLGMGPQSVYTITLTTPREVAAREAVLHVLRETGMLAATPADAAYVVDVAVLRNHFATHTTAGRFRLRSEVFLEFAFRQGETVVGKVLACGNSETHAQVATKKKITATYQAGLNDALYKLLHSKTFVRLAGDGWRPGTPDDASDEYTITHIHKDEFYGPTDFIRKEVEKASKAFEARGARRLVLADFAMKDPKFAKQKKADPEFAVQLMPELVREHLNAFYPGAFETIERGEKGDETEGILVTGDLLRFKIGSFNKRALIGFGAGKDKLELAAIFKDASRDEDLYKLDILTSSWGEMWQFKRGQIKDMADQAARDIAYFLVKTLAPDYQTPADLEVPFDEEPDPSS
jgi:hypothetical protein